MEKQSQQGGSRTYLISIVMVAVLGGLLFGYDTAVISGAEKGLQAFIVQCPHRLHHRLRTLRTLRLALRAQALTDLRRHLLLSLGLGLNDA